MTQSSSSFLPLSVEVEVEVDEEEGVEVVPEPVEEGGGLLGGLELTLGGSVPTSLK
jgi:hypothetical protein